MANTATLRVEVEGAQDLMKKLRIFEQNVRQRIAVKMLQAAARPVIADAKQRVPKRYGALRQSLGVVTRKYPSGKVVAVIGARSGVKSKLRSKLSAKGVKVEPAFYAHLVEFGTKPHAVGTGSVRVRRSTRRVNGRPVPVELGPGPQKGAMHPGARPKPFLRPAWDRNKGQLLGIMGRVLESEMGRELNKGVRRASA